MAKTALNLDSLYPLPDDSVILRRICKGMDNGYTDDKSCKLNQATEQRAAKVLKAICEGRTDDSQPLGYFDSV